MGIQERAAELSKYLVRQARREGEMIIVRADDAPDWVADVIYAVHGNLFPDDWTYETIKDAADAIADDGEDAALEPDVYTRTLLDWFVTYPDAAGCCDQAREEYGHSGGIIEQISYGQSLAQSEIVAAVIGQLETLGEDDEDDSEGE